jgi:hypothetical protein
MENFYFKGKCNEVIVMNNSYMQTLGTVVMPPYFSSVASMSQTFTCAAHAHEYIKSMVHISQSLCDFHNIKIQVGNVNSLCNSVQFLCIYAEI